MLSLLRLGHWVNQDVLVNFIDLKSLSLARTNCNEHNFYIYFRTDAFICCGPKCRYTKTCIYTHSQCNDNTSSLVFNREVWNYKSLFSKFANILWHKQIGHQSTFIENKLIFPIPTHLHIYIICMYLYYCFDLTYVN